MPASPEVRKRLSTLGLIPRRGAGTDVEVSGVCSNSRDLRPGELFAALPGAARHGADFVADARERGAAAVLTDREGLEIMRRGLADAAFPVVVAEDPRRSLSIAVSRFFGAQPETVAAVTGTNGKTSVSHFARQIWERLGRSAVNIGTLGIGGAMAAPLRHTTPDPVTLHRHLRALAAEAVTHAAVEASSHGLEQRRLDGVSLTAAAYTSFSQDHIDYHGDRDAYFAAKAGLFERLLPKGAGAVVNINAGRAESIVEIARNRELDLLLVGTGGRGDLVILDRTFDATGQDVRFSWGGKTHSARLSLIGGFQAENALLAAGLAIACGELPEEVFAALDSLETVPGRMQLAAKRSNGAGVFVDYAHTPDAVRTALTALEPHVRGRIVVVFGAGGDRDRDKRAMMGAAAAKHADAVIVTDDNPRSEDPALIRSEILRACPRATEIGDRASAILAGVATLEPGDALLVAGKGHESEQVVGDCVHPFNDAEQASVAVAALEGRGA